jgi:hypothetical protein
MASLAWHPDEAVPWLREKLGPPWDPKAIPGLIKDLESDEFKTRERASRRLEGMGHFARPALKRALDAGPPAETKKRLTELLDKLAPTATSYEERQLRIIDVLEHINTSAARDLLKAMADGGYDPAFADEAKEALRRARDRR